MKIELAIDDANNKGKGGYFLNKILSLDEMQGYQKKFQETECQDENLTVMEVWNLAKQLVEDRHLQIKEFEIKYGQKTITDVFENCTPQDVKENVTRWGSLEKGHSVDTYGEIAGKKVILLLNIFFLSSKERKEMLENSHLRHVYIHSDRVTMYPYGEEKPKNGGTKMFAWFVWDKEYDGEPTLSWI